MKENKAIIEFMTLMNDYELTPHEKGLRDKIVKANCSVFKNCQLLPLAHDMRKKELIAEVENKK